MKWLALFGALLAPLTLSAAEKDPRTLLQEGLFEEEASHDYDKAAAAYGALVEQYDAARPLAATALFRMAEIRAHEKRSADAVALYQRVLVEFPAQEALAKLSRERLLALGAPGTVPPAKVGVTDEEALELAHLREVVKGSPDLLNSNLGGNTPLNRAAEAGWLEVARFLLENGARVEGAPPYDPPLFAAASHGHKDLVDLLLAHGATVDATSAWDLTPLMSACRNGFPEVTRVLLKHQANVKAATAQGETPLHDACAADRNDLAALLLESGAETNAWYKVPNRAALPASAIRGDAPGWSTALLIACHNGNVALVKLLLAHGADPNLSDGHSALSVAVEQPNRDLLEALLAGGADLKLEANQDALLRAASPPWQPELVQLLLAKGAPADGHPAQVAYAPLLGSIRNLNLTDAKPAPAPADLTSLRRVWEALLAAGAEINAQDAHGITVLGEVTRQPKLPLELAAWLIGHGADPALRDKSGNTPLDLASGERRLELERQVVFPKLVQPGKVTIALRLARLENILELVVGQNAPTVADVLRKALVPAMVPAARTGAARIVQETSLLPLNFELLVYRAGKEGAPLEEAARVSIDVNSKTANTAAWPALRAGDVVVLFKASKDGDSDGPRKFQQWLTDLGLGPEIEHPAKASGPLLSIRAVAEVSDSTSSAFDLVAGGRHLQVPLDNAELLDESALLSATAVTEADHAPAVLLTLNEEGTRQLASITTTYAGKQLGFIVGGQLIATPQVMTPVLGGKLELTGSLSAAQARQLAAQLNAGIAKDGFVTAPGEYRFFRGRVVVEARVKAGGFLHWNLASGGRQAGDDPESKTSLDSGWFIFPESTSRIWIYEGGRRLTAVKFDGNDVNFENTKESPTLLAHAPKAVQERFQQAMEKKSPEAR